MGKEVPNTQEKLPAEIENGSPPLFVSAESRF
jgi:hypothetical protein